MPGIVRGVSAAVAGVLGVGLASWGALVLSNAFQPHPDGRPSTYLVLGGTLSAIGVLLLVRTWMLVTAWMQRPWLWLVAIIGLCLALAFLIGGGH